MIYLYSSENAQRLSYIAHHIFKNTLGVDFTIVTERTVFKQQSGMCINYSKEELNHGLRIHPCGLLFEKGVRKAIKPEPSEWKGYLCFFRQAQGDIPFDIFAASFYLLTLYEEYFPERLDEHGRFDPKESLAYRNGFLEIPLIDRWAQLLKEELEKTGLNSTFAKRKYRFISTFDIDHPYLYLKKSLIKSAGGAMRDLLKYNLRNSVERFSVLCLSKPDPYMEAIRWIDSMHKDAGRFYYLFVLMRDEGKYGRKTRYPLTDYYHYLKNSRSAIVGLHPSYDTYQNCEELIAERRQLENVLGKTEIPTTRQHFLRMCVPGTFRDLIAAGFKEDFTLAYAHAPGFRSGTAIPHHFYDVEQDEITGLLLRPTVLMDSTLITHQRLTPEEALEKIKRLTDECKQSGGDYVSLWHNSNLTGRRDNNPWIDVFVESFHYAVSLEND